MKEIGVLHSLRLSNFIMCHRGHGRRSYHPISVHPTQPQEQQQTSSSSSSKPTPTRFFITPISPTPSHLSFVFLARVCYVFMCPHVRDVLAAFVDGCTYRRVPTRPNTLSLDDGLALQHVCDARQTADQHNSHIITQQPSSHNHHHHQKHSAHSAFLLDLKILTHNTHPNTPHTHTQTHSKPTSIYSSKYILVYAARQVQRYGIMYTTQT